MAEKKTLFAGVARQGVPDRPLDEGDQVPVALEDFVQEAKPTRTRCGRVKVVPDRLGQHVSRVSRAKVSRAKVQDAVFAP